MLCPCHLFSAEARSLLWAQDFAEAIAQLAMFPPGREALLQDPAVVEALQQVAAQGWTSEARMHAESALKALKPPDEHRERVEGGDKHVMVSYQVRICLSVCTSVYVCGCVRLLFCCL